MATTTTKVSIATSRYFTLLFVFLHDLSHASVRLYSANTCYGTKTSYGQLFANNDRQTLMDFSFRFAPPTCQAIHISGLFRHGTRFPSAKDIRNGYDLADRIKNKVNDKYQELNDWTPIVPPSRAKEITYLGRAELRGLGERFGHRYKDLLASADISELYFQVSHKKRTYNSADNFREGLEVSLQRNIPEQFVLRNDLLRFYDNCTEFVKSVEENKDAMKDLYAFIDGPEIKGVLRKVKERLGLEGLNILMPEDLKTIYVMLASEMTHTGRSAWNGVFDNDDLRILEYTSDLKNYWRKGHGYPINYLQACPLLTDVFLLMDAAIELHNTDAKYTRAALRFGHAETLMPFVALLGLFKEKVPPRADNFQEVKDRQLYRGGRVAPLAGNVMMVLYHCNSDHHKEAVDYKMPSGVSWPSKLDDYMVQLFLHEEPVKFPFCDYHLCPYKEVKKHYSQHINCKFEKLCKIQNHELPRDEL